jgi:hypothetical protein
MNRARMIMEDYVEYVWQYEMEEGGQEVVGER